MYLEHAQILILNLANFFSMSALKISLINSLIYLFVCLFVYLIVKLSIMSGYLSKTFFSSSNEMLPFLSASAKSNKALKIMRNDLSNSPT